MSKLELDNPEAVQKEVRDWEQREEIGRAHV